MNCERIPTRPRLVVPPMKTPSTVVAPPKKRLCLSSKRRRQQTPRDLPVIDLTVDEDLPVEVVDLTAEVADLVKDVKLPQSLLVSTLGHSPEQVLEMVLQDLKRPAAAVELYERASPAQQFQPPPGMESEEVLAKMNLETRLLSPLPDTPPPPSLPPPGCTDLNYLCSVPQLSQTPRNKLDLLLRRMFSPRPRRWGLSTKFPEIPLYRYGKLPNKWYKLLRFDGEFCEAVFSDSSGQKTRCWLPKTLGRPPTDKTTTERPSLFVRKEGVSSKWYIYK